MATKIDVHMVEEKDKARIHCSGKYGKCMNQADICEHVHWYTGNTSGISFFYYCRLCFETKVE